MQDYEVNLQDINKIWDEIITAKIKVISLQDSAGNPIVPYNSFTTPLENQIEKIKKYFNMLSCVPGTYKLLCKITNKSGVISYKVIKGNPGATNITPHAMNAGMSTKDFEHLLELEKENTRLTIELKNALEKIENLELEVEENDLNDQKTLSENTNNSLLDKFAPLAEKYLPTVLEMVMSKFLPSQAPPLNDYQAQPVSEPAKATRFTDTYYNMLIEWGKNDPQKLQNELNFVKTNYPAYLDIINQKLQS